MAGLPLTGIPPSITSSVLARAGNWNARKTDASIELTRPDNALTRWAARSLANWEFLREYTDRAHDEWRYRWDEYTVGDRG